MTSPHPLRSTWADPVTHVADGGVTFYSGEQASGNSEIIAENLNRKRGVWIQCTEVTAKVIGIYIGIGNDTKVRKLKAAYTDGIVGMMAVAFIPGTQAIRITTVTGVDADWVAMEY